LPRLPKLEKAAEENTYDNVKAKALEYAERKQGARHYAAEHGRKRLKTIVSTLQKLQSVVERRAVATQDRSSR
jgi:hypothetical protein